MIRTGAQHKAQPEPERQGRYENGQEEYGALDRTARFIIGAALLPTGVVLLGGWHGDITGVLVSVFALINLVTSLKGRCSGYIPLGIPTLDRERDDTSFKRASDPRSPLDRVQA